MMYDVVVVGAGPAGTAAATDCARAGLNTLCIEEHGTIGYPVQCAGLLSTAAFAETRVSRRSILNEVSGARIVSGAGSAVQFDAGKTRAVVVDRGALDREMADEAAGQGTDFLLKTAVCGIRDNAVVTRGAARETIGFRILIAADGPRSTIARLLGMKRAGMYLAGIQADVPCTCDPRLVEIYPDASPDFFGWSIPISAKRTRVGLCSRSGADALFSRFVRQFGQSSLHLVTGTIPLGVMPKTYGHRTLFVGDAAGFAKPTSGGGVYTGIRSARHAAAVACEACANDRFDDAFLAGYETRWKADMGNDLALGLRLLGVRQRMSPEEMDRLIQALDDPAILRTICEYGDMDRPSALARKLLMNPAVLRLIGPLARTGLSTLLKSVTRP